MSVIEERTLRERLADVRAAAERDATRTPAAARALLEARARQLARLADNSATSQRDALDLLVCQVGDERLGIPLGSIVAIARVTSVARLPRAIAPVYGVTSWRGRPLTVLSVTPVALHITELTRLVVLGTGARAALAVVVDGVDDVVRIAHAELSSAGPGPRHGYALGVAPDGMLVLNGDALLQPETIAT